MPAEGKPKKHFRLLVWMMEFALPPSQPRPSRQSGLACLPPQAYHKGSEAITFMIQLYFASVYIEQGATLERSKTFI